MGRNVIIGLLLIAAIAAGAFAFFQTQNLTDLQNTSTEVVSDLREAGTQGADEAIATGTSLAESSFSTATQAAQNAQDAAETGTQSADNARGTQTQQVANARATGTELADTANSAATESADLLATQASIAIDNANNLATQQIELTVAAAVYSDAQATANAQNLTMASLLEEVGMNGAGLSGASAEIPAGFHLFVGDGYEMLLADSFVGGDFVSDTLDNLEEALSDADLDDTFRQLSKQDDNFLFFAIDAKLVQGVSRATISLIREEALSEGTSISDYMSSALISLQGDFALITSDIVAVNGQATGRIIIDQQLSDAAIRQVQYIFELDNQFYILTFSTPIMEYANIRESLETTANSLRIRN